jgi:nicotinate-nucleotide--dimethylbenzimidazole phosphoribosyltransferase
MNELSRIMEKVEPLSGDFMEQAAERQKHLTKPAGSLGILEDLSVKIAGITRSSRPRMDKKAVCIFAADHGVADEGVSAYPREVTAQMVHNFLEGGAAISVLARHAGARVVVIDAGVASKLDPHPGLANRKIGFGTRNMIREDAMTRAQAEESLLLGISVVEEELSHGLDIVALGEMGIANTASATAIASAITGIEANRITGRGTGIDDARLAHKIDIIDRALSLRKPDKSDPIGILQKVGGFEIGGIAGAVIGAAARRVPVVIDGFISTAGALLAYAICPGVLPYVIASHASVETGHSAMLSCMGLSPLFDFRMRLGEGTGACLAIGIVEAACRLLDEMATFGEAGVSEK